MRHAVGRTVAAVALLVGGAGPLGCSTDQEKAAEHLERAEAYQADGQEKEALLELRSALQLDPKSASTNFRIAQVLEGQQEIGDAAFYYGEAYRLDPERTDAAIAQGRLLSFAEPERARALADEVLAREPGNASAHVLLSHLALIRKDTDAALRHALTATELKSRDAEAAHQLGVVHQARIREAREIEKREPEDALYESAIKAFDVAAENGTPRQQAAALRERGRVLASWPGHADQAEGTFRELVQRTAASGDPLLRREGAQAAVVFARRTQNEAFLRWSLEQELEADPEDVATWSEMANLTARLDGSDAGQAVLARLIEQRPRDARAQIAYARLLVREHDEQAGIAHLEKVQGDVDDPAAILGFLVDLYYVVGQPEQAAALVERMEKEHPGSERTELARAQRMLAEKRWDEAAQLLRQLNGKNESVDSQYLLAIAEAQQGRIPEATQAVNRAYELGAGTDHEAAILAIRAQIQYAARAWPELLRTTNQLARLQRSLADRLRLMRIEALFETGRLELANRAIGYEFDNEEPSAEVALLFARYRGADDPKQARDLLERAAKRQPGHVAIQTALAQLDVAEGRTENALAVVDQALAADIPERRQAALRALRARVLMTLGRTDEARTEAERAFQADPSNPQNAEILVGVYTAQGRTDDAIATFEEAREVGALGIPGEELLARLYTQVGRDDQAIAIFERLIQQGGSRPTVQNDLAFLLAKNGRDLDRALELARRAQAELGEDANVADTLGYVYYRKGLYGPAVEQFRFAIEAAEKDQIQPAQTASYHYHLALALRGLERDQEAIAALETALARDPDLTEAKQALAELQNRAGGAPAPAPRS